MTPGRHYNRISSCPRSKHGRANIWRICPDLFATQSACMERVPLDRERYNDLKSWGSQWKIQLQWQACPAINAGDSLGTPLWLPGSHRAGEMSPDASAVLTIKFLKEVLPLDGFTTTSVRNHLQAVTQRCEDELGGRADDVRAGMRT